MADIESLELQITGDSSKAKAGLDALITTLDTLKTKTKGGVGLTSVANQVGKLADSAGKLNGSEGAKLESLAKGLNALSGLGNLKLSSSVANQVSAMGTAVRNLDGVDYSKLGDLAAAVQPLTALGKSNLGSVLSQIKKLPEVMAELGKVDINTFDAKIKQLTASLKPLADEMQKVANGFSAFPAKIQKLISSSSQVPTSNAASAKSFTNLAAKITATVYTIKRAARVVASWINKSNEYTENLNLFTVAMGQYANSAMEYANTVSEAMGIDTSDWIRNQGVFMTLATGFGVVGDRAATMSQQMTQLGYDISSYYNIAVEEAMQKLKSGFSGELEPLRNLGYDLSQAKLEAIALSLGIDKTVSSMTQAEKAELRYYAIMTQVTQVQGDMARTLNDPANQLRVLQAQLQMAARSLGNLFIPALNAVLPYAIAAAKVIRVLADAVAGLFGFEFPEMDTSGVSNLATGAGDASEAIGEAADNAKKLNKTMLGIDELNVVSDSSGSGSGTDASAGTGFGFELPTYDFIGEAANSRVNQIVEEMKEWLGITGEIDSWADFFNTRLGKILTLVGLIGTGFALWKISKNTITGIATLKDLLAKTNMTKPMMGAAGGIFALTGGAIELTGIIDAIKNGLDGFNLVEILGGGGALAGGAALLGKSLGSAVIGGAIGGIVAGVPAFITGVYDAIVSGIDWLNSLLITAGATAAGAGIGALIGSIGGPIGALIGLAVGLLTDFGIWLWQNFEKVEEWFNGLPGIVKVLGTTLVFVLTGGIVPIITGIITLIKKWNSVVETFQNGCSAVGQFFVDLWNGIVSVWNTVATWFDTNVIQPVVNFFSGLWVSVSGFFVNLWTSISTAASDCWNAIVTFFSPAISWFSQLFGSIWQTISDIFYNIGVIASGCWQIIQAVWGIVSAWFNTKVIQPVVNFFVQLWSTISTAAINAWNGIKNAAIGAWNGIKTVFSTIGSWVNQYIIQPVGNFFSNLWTGFINGAKNAWAGVKSVFGSVVSFFQTTFQNAWAGIVKVFSTAGEIFTNIKDAILTAFKSVVNGIIRGLNNVIAVPFNGINTALNKIKNINILGLTPFSSLKSISVPVIPQLAQGGVVDAGQLFVAREAGAELVGNVGRKTAVMNNDQIVESVSQGVYQAVVAAMRANSGNEGGAQSVNVYLDGKQVYASIEQHRKERGASLMGNQVYSYSY